ncbi:MAG: hypothetical protein LBG77_08380, partial [Dysgonamonadaceae bacterium]|nr:hypothetical protein [Dysgonamonadaceae bacterium]
MLNRISDRQNNFRAFAFAMVLALLVAFVPLAQGAEDSSVYAAQPTLNIVVDNARVPVNEKWYYDGTTTQAFYLDADFT